ncbi:Uncharacterised protein [Mycobacteroides abscessus subsp. abscessus]|nr:Uncharacterised protein [Mycobacteroides abscessus subsp. abscessus]
MGGQFRRGHPAGEHDVALEVEGLGERAQLLLVGAAARDHQHRAVDAGADLAHGDDQRVLPLARHQPGQAQDGRAFIGAEDLGVHAGG